MAGILAPVAEPKRKATYDDLLAAPDNKVAEILDGELILSPRPASPHERASTVLLRLLSPFDPASDDPTLPGGWWIAVEPEIHLGADVVVPDLAAWRRERMPRIPNAPWHELPPDWVCETLSPSTEQVDRGRKLRIYARAGVPHLWLVDPRVRTLEVFRRGEDGLYVLLAVHAGGERVRAEPFAAVEIELGRLWLD